MHLFVLTGAGISAESGLRTFRDPGGLWEQHDPRTLATPEAFARDPDLVHRFYNWRRQAARDAQPNPAHHALARLQAAMVADGSTMTLVTQNVDDLHGRAGADAIGMHGSHLTIRCLRCETAFPWSGDLSTGTPCPACGRAGLLRPDIVWFGDMPRALDRIGAALDRADAFVAIGTSGAVYPAAGFIAAVRRRGVPTIEFNLEPADNANLFDRAVYGLASATVPRFVAVMLEGGWDAAFAAAVPT